MTQERAPPASLGSPSVEDAPCWGAGRGGLDHKLTDCCSGLGCPLRPLRPLLWASTLRAVLYGQGHPSGGQCPATTHQQACEWPTPQGPPVSRQPNGLRPLPLPRTDGWVSFLPCSAGDLGWAARPWVLSGQRGRAHPLGGGGGGVGAQAVREQWASVQRSRGGEGAGRDLRAVVMWPARRPEAGGASPSLSRAEPPRLCPRFREPGFRGVLWLPGADMGAAGSSWPPWSSALREPGLRAVGGPCGLCLALPPGPAAWGPR